MSSSKKFTTWSKRNIGNYTTFNNILTNRIEIQSSDSSGLIIFSDDITNPEFSFDTTNGDLSINGNLNVTGSATFNSLEIATFDLGLFLIGGDNTGNTWDLGIVSSYSEDGGTTTLYSGFVKDFSDTLERWVLFKEITTEPDTTITGIGSATLDSILINSVFVNDGSVTNPTYSFDNDQSSGFYRIGDNNLGLSINGTNSMDFQDGTTEFNSIIQYNSGITKSITTIEDPDTTYTITNNDNFIIFSTTNPTTATLPSVAVNIGLILLIVKTGATGTLTINTDNGTEYIDDNSTTSISLTTQFDRVELISDGVRWYSI
jgi:hypothetical protein